jgi:hypothetical protein
MFLPERDKALQQRRLGQSDRGDISTMESKAYRARRDCCSPVPLITTSHRVSERDSMVEVEIVREEGKGRKTDLPFL